MRISQLLRLNLTGHLSSNVIFIQLLLNKRADVFSQSAGISVYIDHQRQCLVLDNCCIKLVCNKYYDLLRLGPQSSIMEEFQKALFCI